MAVVLVSSVSLEDILAKNIFLGSREAQEHTSVKGDFKFGVATTPADMVDVFDIRYRSYKASGYLNPKYPSESQLEFDEHDMNAALFYVRNMDSGSLHCTGRLVFDVNGSLPMDEYYSLDKFRHEIGYYKKNLRLVEFSRLISHPTGQKQLNKELVRFIFQFAVAQGVDYIVGFGRMDIKHYYDKWGFKDIVPYEPIDVRKLDGPLTPPMKFYPHAMSINDIRWDAI